MSLSFFFLSFFLSFFPVFPFFSLSFIFPLLFLVRPEAIACGADLSFSPDVFFPTRDLRDAWADRREILHDGQY